MMKKILLLSVFAFFLFQSATVYAIVPVKENTAPQSAVTESVNQFNQLSKKERKQKMTEVKKQLKLFKQNQREGKSADENTVLLVILALSSFHRWLFTCMRMQSIQNSGSICC